MRKESNRALTLVMIYSGAAIALLFDLERVEVLKGPQGLTWQGRRHGLH